ncbi:MAG: C69 family dipeptidase [Planctomycetaceae bacterium]|nr:C69 family dipeptidase [Planctomycetaceae bacterium]
MRTRHDWTFFLALAVSVVLAASDSRACTSIMVGRKASVDGSVMTSHTCDSHDDSSAISIVPHAKHKPGEEVVLSRREEDPSGPMKRLRRKTTGTIPEVPETFGYMVGVYGIMNEHQLAIGESTFEGRPELASRKGLIDCDTLTRLMLQRAKTAREAIRLAGALIEKYGWCDLGEALTVADTREVWLMEIVGPGKDAVGAVWVARRVPDDHVSIVANGSRIEEIDFSKPDFFMASKNVQTLAERKGYWDPKSGQPFRFCDAYSPESRAEVATTRREWRVLALLAPSLHLNPNSNRFPFSVKPEKPVAPKTVMGLFRDTFEDTDFDVLKDFTVPDGTGKAVKSPLANPFMPYDMNKMLRVNGGWGWRGERCLARWYCTYATVTQSRGWLPDPVGGIVWFGYANPAMTTYVPIYAGVTDLPDDYKTDGRTTGFSRRSAWWAFKQVATIASHRWGDMRVEVAAVRAPLQDGFFSDQRAVAEKACQLLKQDTASARAFLTEETAVAARKTVDAYWSLGTLLWTKYDEQW